MSDLFNRILGIGAGEKRIYQIDKDQLTAEEFEQGRVIADILWSEDGLVHALGPVWNMVHDKRFITIEDAFLNERQSVFGGDATQGRRYINYTSAFQLTSIADLEQYSEILGEGRFFRARIVVDGLDPQVFHEASDEVLWKYIRRECPNYFRKDSSANYEAMRLYKLFRFQLLALVDDYAELPFCDEWLDLESGILAHEESEYQVFAEVDFLERALTLRASLRNMAMKVLKSNAAKLDKMLDNVTLTDYESDLILKKIYSVPYDKLYTIPAEIIAMANAFNKEPYEIRKQHELATLKAQSQKFVAGLKSGAIEPLRADVKIEYVDQSDEEKMIKQLMEDPIKYEAFQLLAEAEKNGDQTTADRLHKALFENAEPLDMEGIIKIKQETIGQRVASSVKSILQ